MVKNCSEYLRTRKKAVLWGGGHGYDVFVQLRGLDMLNVLAITDNADLYVSRIDGIPVVKPNELSEIDFDYLIICVIDDTLFKSILKDALKLEIDRDKIIPLRTFTIPFFNIDDYIRIKDSKISIISDYCFAGYLYHRFGLMFRSPTINMFTNNHNYLKFIGDLEYYMNQQMKEDEDWRERLYGDAFMYPRGKVADVEWVFNHDIEFESARKRWDKGVERFNWDNYIVIMTIENDEMAYKFQELPIRHKIGFYWKDLNLQSVVCMPRWNDPAFRTKYDYCFSGMVNKIATDGEGIRAINWMKALLHEEGYVRFDL